MTSIPHLPLPMNNRKLVGLTAPSGAGKSSLAKRVLEELPSMRLSVSVTTRPPRDYEQHGREYYFVSGPEFERLIAEDALLEYEEVYPGRFYGTPLSALTESDTPLLLDIDVKGAVRVHSAHGGLFIFIAPPSAEDLEVRLRKRGTESAETLELRLHRAKDELTYADRFDAVVINDSFDRAAEEVISLVQAYLAHE